MNLGKIISSPNVSKIIKWVNLFYKKIKKENQDYIVIWYDSLTISGYVNWQGEINDNNKVFSTMSDYFFLDYRWNKDSLKSSEKFSDNKRIMIGVDFYDRGTSYGGYNSYKAGKIAIDNDYSEAFFAIGYPYEQEYGMDSFSTFYLNDKRLWSDYTDKLIYLQSKQFEIGKYNILNISEEIKNIKRPDIYLSIEIHNPKNRLINYFVSFILASDEGSDGFIGCVDSYRRRFIKDTTHCYTKAKDPPTYILKSTTDTQFEENLFIEAGEIIDKFRDIKLAEIYIYLNDPNIDKDITFQNFTIRELLPKSESLLSTIKPKVVKKLPIVSSFNIGEGNYIYNFGIRNSYHNYSYLLDYDLNVELSENPIEMKSKSHLKQIPNYNVDIDINDGYIGTSCLKLRASIRKWDILSHKLYDLNIYAENNAVYLFVVYKIKSEVEKNYEYDFEIIDNNPYKPARTSLILNEYDYRLNENWKYLLYRYDKIEPNSQLVFYSHLKAKENPEYNEFDIKIGYISLTKEMPYKTMQIINDDIIDIVYRARINIHAKENKKVFDLFLEVDKKFSTYKIKKITLFFNDTFLHNIYFTRYVIKALEFKPDQDKKMVIQAFITTINGEYFEMEKKIIINENEIRPIHIPDSVLQYNTLL